MKHWTNLRLLWIGMREWLIYCSNRIRHIDTFNLFHPNGGYRSDGMFCLIHNVVNGTIEPDDSFIDGNIPKKFCIYSQSDSNHGGCKDSFPEYNHHYEIKNSSILVFGPYAAYYMPHKVEGIIQGKWTSLLLSRNYNLDVLLSGLLSDTLTL